MATFGARAAHGCVGRYLAGAAAFALLLPFPVVNNSRCCVQVDILRPLTTAQMAAVAEAVEEHEFASGQDIITQGDRNAKHFYIVVEGTVDVLVDGKAVAKLEGGQFFGERALLVRCASACVRWLVGASEHRACGRLLGDLRD
jgi:hypothetical protein